MHVCSRLHFFVVACPLLFFRSRAPKQDDDDDDDAFVDAALKQASAGSAQSTVEKLSQRDQRNPHHSRGTDLLDDDDEEEIDEAEIDAMIAEAAEKSPFQRTPQTKGGGDVAVAGKHVVPMVQAQQEEVAVDEDTVLEGRAVGIDLVGVSPLFVTPFTPLLPRDESVLSRNQRISPPVHALHLGVTELFSISARPRFSSKKLPYTSHARQGLTTEIGYFSGEKLDGIYWESKTHCPSRFCFSCTY